MTNILIFQTIKGVYGKYYFSAGFSVIIKYKNISKIVAIFNINRQKKLSNLIDNYFTERLVFWF